MVNLLMASASLDPAHMSLASHSIYRIPEIPFELQLPQRVRWLRIVILPYVTPISGA